MKRSKRWLDITGIISENTEEDILELVRYLSSGKANSEEVRVLIRYAYRYGRPKPPFVESPYSDE